MMTRMPTAMSAIIHPGLVGDSSAAGLALGEGAAEDDCGAGEALVGVGVGVAVGAGEALEGEGDGDTAGYENEMWPLTG